MTADAIVEIAESGRVEDCKTGGVKGGVITEAVDAEEDEEGVEDTGAAVMAAW